MLAATLQAVTRRVRRPVIWMLTLALLAYGHTSVMVQLMGPVHRHDVAVPSTAQTWLDGADAMFKDVRAWHAEIRERLLPGQQAHPHDEGERHAHAHPHADPVLQPPVDAHAHAHAGYERHHHDAHDPTVMALEGPSGTSDADAASLQSAGSASLPLALAPCWAPHLLPDAAAPWSAASAPRWTDAALCPPDQPPRA